MPLASDLAGYLPRGQILPASGFDGRLWLHTPAGRAWERVYSGTTWYSTFGFGPATLYVDAAAGTDAADQGFGPGALAYRKVQYALDQLPALLFGDVTINLAAGTYRETVTIRGKHFAGDYRLTLQGAYATDYSASAPSASGNGAGSGSAGFGTLTKTGAGRTAGADVNKLLEITGGTGAGQRFIVHANTADTWTITGRWTTIPDGTTAFRIASPATRLTGADAGAETTPVRARVVQVLGGQQSVVLDGLRLDYAAGENVFIGGQSECMLRNCQVVGGGSGVNVEQYAVADLLACALSLTSYPVIANNGLLLHLLDSRVTGAVHAITVVNGGVVALLARSYLGQSSGYGVNATAQGKLILAGYAEIDGAAFGLVIDTGSQVLTSGDYGAAATNRIANCANWGAYALNTGTIVGASGWTYLNNAAGSRTPTTISGGGTS
jgi:hypothetical protein